VGVVGLIYPTDAQPVARGGWMLGPGPHHHWFEPHPQILGPISIVGPITNSLSHIFILGPIAKFWAQSLTIFINNLINKCDNFYPIYPINKSDHGPTRELIHHKNCQRFKVTSSFNFTE